MKNLKVIIILTATDETDLNHLRTRISEQIRAISNPVRTYEGITTVSSVQIVPSDSCWEFD